MSSVETGQMSAVETGQMSVLSQQKTSILSQQQTFGPEPAEFWPGTRGILKLKVVSGLPVGASLHAQWPG